MAGELLTSFTAADLYRETSMGYEQVNTSAIYGGFRAGTAITSGWSRGISLQKFIIAGQLYEYYNLITIVPAAVALATGLTFRFMITDDGTSAADLGLVAQLEVTPYNLSTASAPVDFSLSGSKGTATTGNVTLSATSGVIVVSSIAIVSANLASLAAGNVLGVRVRRVGDVAADTCPGRILLMGGTITNT